MFFMQWNIRGFNSNREHVKVLFRDHNLSAICIQETKFGNYPVNFGVNYSIYKSAPYVGVRAQGGTCIIVRKSINHKSIPLNSILQACAVQVFTSRWITLCSLYIEPLIERHLRDAADNK